MRTICIAIATSLLTVSVLGSADAERCLVPPNAGEKGPRQFVIAELFTSEGCSGCPPAESLLKHLSEERPIAGVEVIALEEHVDYWNQLGWIDPFSSRQFSERQEQYASTFHNDGVYTPQLIVDGAAEVVGSRSGEAEEIIQRAASLPKATLTLKEIGERKRGQATFQLDVSSLPSALNSHKLELWIAVTERGLQSDVQAGENSGYRLQHAAVVRSLRKLETLDSAVQFQSQVPVQLEGEWKQDNLAIIVFLVDSSSRRIVGIGRQ
ncbi:MAG TPA: DUF1223 domain-containing protein [Candidatus Acidoferrum sp.]|nr:DUF1223 domain-containing protein [Candidatus Acidoferrum sp.]